MKTGSAVAIAVAAWGLSVGVTVGSASDDRRAPEIADYYRAAFVGAPAVSADGVEVAFAVTRYELEAGESWPEIWMVGADVSGPRPTGPVDRPRMAW